MRFVSVDLYYIKIASTPTCISSNYVKICTFLFFLIFFMDVNLHLEYLFGFSYRIEKKNQIYIISWLVEHKIEQKQ